MRKFGWSITLIFGILLTLSSIGGFLSGDFLIALVIILMGFSLIFYSTKKLTQKSGKIGINGTHRKRR